MRLSALDDLTNKTPACHIYKLLFHLIAFFWNGTDQDVIVLLQEVL